MFTIEVVPNSAATSSNATLISASCKRYWGKEAKRYIDQVRRECGYSPSHDQTRQLLRRQLGANVPRNNSRSASQPSGGILSSCSSCRQKELSQQERSVLRESSFRSELRIGEADITSNASAYQPNARGQRGPLRTFRWGAPRSFQTTRSREKTAPDLAARHRISNGSKEARPQRGGVDSQGRKRLGARV